MAKINALQVLLSTPGEELSPLFHIAPFGDASQGMLRNPYWIGRFQASENARLAATGGGQRGNLVLLLSHSKVLQ